MKNLSLTSDKLTQCLHVINILPTPTPTLWFDYTLKWRHTNIKNPSIIPGDEESNWHWHFSSGHAINLSSWNPSWKPFITMASSFLIVWDFILMATIFCYIDQEERVWDWIWGGIAQKGRRKPGELNSPGSAEQRPFKDVVIFVRLSYQTDEAHSEYSININHYSCCDYY